MSAAVNKAGRKSQPGFRNQWRVDFKWVFAIPLTVALASLLFFMTLYQVNSGNNARRTISTMRTPLTSYEPVQDSLSQVDPQLYSYLQGSEFAASIYEDPDSLGDMVEGLPDDDGGRLDEVKSILTWFSMPMFFLGNGVHEALGWVLVPHLVLIAVLAALTIALSRRLGRLVSPGVCLFAASAFPLIAVQVLRWASSGWTTEGTAADGQEVIERSMQPLAEAILDQAVTVYGFALFLSIVLLLLAGLAFMALRAQKA